MRARLKLEEHGRAQQPIIELVPGSRPYLWIGDEDGCYATVDVNYATSQFVTVVQEAHKKQRTWK